MDKYQTPEQVYCAYMDALHDGKSPDIGSCILDCRPDQRAELEADLRVAEFMFANHLCCEVSDSTVKKAQEAILKLRSTEVRISAARTNMSTRQKDPQQSPIERLASALGIFLQPTGPRSRRAAVFARGDSGTVSTSRAADRMQYRLWRKRGLAAAENLTASLDLSSRPVDLDPVCEHLNLLVSTEPENSEIEGYMVTDGEVGGIVINSLIGDSRKHRFTLAHEIGHFVLHKGKQSYIRQDTGDSLDRPGDSSDEIEANSFAGALLMPIALLGQETMAAEPDMDLVEEAADVYDVSFCAAAHRIITISDWPCTFVLSHEGVVQWVAYSEHFGGYVRSKQKLNPNSAADALASANPGRTLSLKLPQSVWLADRAESGAEIVDRSRNMGNGYVYTILVLPED